MSETTLVPKPTPIHLRSTPERHAHVAQRLLERSGISWDSARVAALEQKIKFVRTQLAQNRAVAAILPHQIGEEKNNTIHFWRVLISGYPHTFVWSQFCKGLISYRGPGELKEPSPPRERAAIQP